MGFWDFIWTIFWLFLLVAWFWIVITVIADVFRSRDLNGLQKGLWVFFIIIIPWLGVLIYIIVRGDGMRDRDVEAMEKAEEVRRKYIQNVAGTTSTADELTKLAELRDKGVISADEFETQKAKLLG